MINKLNIGAGDTSLAGYTNWDRKDGHEAAPLDLPDESLEEIRASHVLEHFSHKSIANVLADWARCLKPGGRLRVAVPNFQWIAEQYMAGAQVPVQAYVMGGHVDSDDHHGVVFDESTLRDLLRAAGLGGISFWESELEDCASLDASLNLQAYKLPAEYPSTVAVMSCPRLGFMDNFFSAMQALTPMKIPLQRFFGAFWEQGMERVISGALEKSDPEWILTLDYDSVFSLNDVQSLLHLAMRHPEVDALAALQVHRQDPRPLMTMPGKQDGPVALDRKDLTKELLQLGTAHFGLTLIKSSKLKTLPRPWFHSQPDPETQTWTDQKIDSDISFWKHWEEAGNTLFLANRIPIGHLEMMIRWPDKDMRAIYQTPNDFWENGVMEGSWK